LFLKNSAIVGVSLRSAFSSPGATTIERAERMGIRPVMNEALPAVQLAWPYQLVNMAPSLAIRSTFAVGWPRALPPPDSQPKSFQPLSSVMRMTMLGLLLLAGCFVIGVALGLAVPAARKSGRRSRELAVPWARWIWRVTTLSPTVAFKV